MRVDLVPIGEIPPPVKREASAVLRSVYDADVSIASDQDLPSEAYDSGRDQYHAESFIELAADVARGEKAIGITPADLYYRRRNYVFGLAYLDGRSCVVSTNRLSTSSDGGFSRLTAEEVFADRLRKEIIHEAGHMLGLDHCENNRCAMSFSPTVQEVDRKEETLCGSCQRELF